MDTPSTNLQPHENSFGEQRVCRCPIAPYGAGRSAGTVMTGKLEILASKFSWLVM